MDSHYPLLSMPLWFGSPWHGVVFRALDYQGGSAAILRPNGTDGMHDRAASSAGIGLTMSMWDIGRPDQPAPPELAAAGGAFLGRSLVNPALNLSGSRPMLLDGELFRVYRGGGGTQNGIAFNLRRIDRETGQLGPIIELTTGVKTASEIGQGANQPAMAGWDGGYIWEGIDLTPDGRSLLIGLRATVGYTNQLVGLLRVDFGGTADEPTATLSVLLDRQAALGVSAREFSSDAQSLAFAQPLDEEEEGPCGTVRRVRTGRLVSYPSTGARSIGVGNRITTDTVAGRLFTAWFTADGGVHLETFDAVKRTEVSVEWNDLSTGEVVTEFHWTENCVSQGSTTTGSVTYLAETISTRTEYSSVTIADVNASMEFTETVTRRTTDVGHNWPQYGDVPWQVEISPVGWLFEGSRPSTGLTHGVLGPPPAQLDREHPITIMYATAQPIPGRGLRPQRCGWKAVGMAAVEYLANAPTGRSALTPVRTIAGTVGGVIDFVSPVVTGASAEALYWLAENGTYNPITGEVVRGWQNRLVGCI